MPNRLTDATSTYLLQHADNPVDWWQWSDAAFDEARRRGVPVLLSVGYASCHWCHVMARESFTDPDTAALINENFIPVKVDREERPDVDACVHDGHPGPHRIRWLADDGVPHPGRGTLLRWAMYFPPHPASGLPSLRQLLTALAEAWRGQPRRGARRRLRDPGRVARHGRSVDLDVAEGRPALLEIDLQGAREVATDAGGAVRLPAPPSWEELVRRLVGRGTEDEAERDRRLATARGKLAAEPEFDVTVVNRRIHAAGEELVELMRSGAFSDHVGPRVAADPVGTTPILVSEAR